MPTAPSDEPRTRRAQAPAVTAAAPLDLPPPPPLPSRNTAAWGPARTPFTTLTAITIASTTLTERRTRERTGGKMKGAPGEARPRRLPRAPWARPTTSLTTSAGVRGPVSSWSAESSSSHSLGRTSRWACGGTSRPRLMGLTVGGSFGGRERSKSEIMPDFAFFLCS